MTRFTVYLPWSSVASIARGGRGRLDLGTWRQGGDHEHRDLLLRNGARAAEEEQGEGDTDPGEDGDREEGGLEALRQRDERVGVSAGRHVVAAAGGGGGPARAPCERRRRV